MADPSQPAMIGPDLRCQGQAFAMDAASAASNAVSSTERLRSSVRVREKFAIMPWLTPRRLDQRKLQYRNAGQQAHHERRRLGA